MTVVRHKRKCAQRKYIQWFVLPDHCPCPFPREDTPIRFPHNNSFRSSAWRWWFDLCSLCSPMPDHCPCPFPKGRYHVSPITIHVASEALPGAGALIFAHFAALCPAIVPFPSPGKIPHFPHNNSFRSSAWRWCFDLCSLCSPMPGHCPCPFPGKMRHLIFIKVVLGGSPRCPDNLSKCHRLYDLGRHIEQP